MHSNVIFVRSVHSMFGGGGPPSPKVPQHSYNTPASAQASLAPPTPTISAPATPVSSRARDTPAAGAATSTGTGTGWNRKNASTEVKWGVHPHTTSGGTAVTSSGNTPSANNPSAGAPAGHSGSGSGIVRASAGRDEQQPASAGLLAPTTAARNSKDGSMCCFPPFFYINFSFLFSPLVC